MKNIVVTGGAGFIGSHLCKKLLLDGNNVFVIDNFNDFYDPNIKSRNIKDITSILNATSGALKVFKGDIRDMNFLQEVFKSDSIDFIVHLAACAGVRPSIDNPVLYTDVNVNGTVNILEIAKLFNVKQFVFASSSSIYGNNKSVPFKETDVADFPISPYAATKKTGELFCHTYHSLHNINIACLRFFTVYGPGQRPDLAIHKFTKLLFEDKKIPFYGDGSTERDYTYIDDIIDGVVKCIKWLECSDNKYEIFNLGESRTISLKKMVSTLEQVIGKKANLNIMPLQSGDVQRTYADVSKAKEVLGYNPQVKFEEGIEKFVEWYKRNAMYPL